MQAQWSEKKPLEPKSFSNDIVETLGTLKTSVSCNGAKIQTAKNTLVADNFRLIPGRDLFDHLGITISQKSCSKTEVNTVKAPCVIKHLVAKEFPEIISRIEISEHHTVNS